MKYKEAIRMVKQGFKVCRPNWKNAYICLSAYPMFYADILVSSSGGGCLTDGVWCFGKFPYFPPKEDREANDWDFILEV